MPKDEKYHNRSNEDREQEAREYVESQEPVIREEPAVLNPGGGNVPEPDRPAPITTAKAGAGSSARKGGAARKGRGR